MMYKPGRELTEKETREKQALIRNYGLPEGVAHMMIEKFGIAKISHTYPDAARAVGYKMETYY